MASWKTVRYSPESDCAACIEATDQSGPIQWHDVGADARLYFTVNVAGCLAIEQGTTGASDCGGSYNAAVQCSRSSCEKCLATGGTFTQFSNCQKDVQSQGVCKSYENAQSEACQGYKDAGSAALDCFPGQNEQQDAFFERVEGIFCGQP